MTNGTLKAQIPALDLCMCHDMIHIRGTDIGYYMIRDHHDGSCSPWRPRHYLACLQLIAYTVGPTAVH
jgi:hypothetical protein